MLSPIIFVLDNADLLEFTMSNSSFFNPVLCHLILNLSRPHADLSCNSILTMLPGILVKSLGGCALIDSNLCNLFNMFSLVTEK